MIPSSQNPSAWIGGAARFGGALFATGLLLVFLVMSRWLGTSPEVLTLRSVEGTDPVSMPVPPAPPPMSDARPEPPPPPEMPDLPKLDLEIESPAPPMRAILTESRMRLDVKTTEFASETPPMKSRSLFAAADLDTQPRLLNRPVVAYPETLLRRGVKEGRVTLEVVIDSRGKVSVKGVVSKSHPDFVPMARNFAANALFSPPKKDGRTVNAVFHWPLLLRP